MILKGSQRGGSGQLALHLSRLDENDHVEIVELRGFSADTLGGAFAEAVAKGTKCKQFLFSLSLNPPKGASATIEDMHAAAEKAEEALGLKGQPRAIVVHEKEGRRHMHVVWSRIDVAEMKALPLPFFRNRLASLSKDLYLEHGWELPDGHKKNGWKSPLNFSLAEWQQCKRLNLHPQEVRQVFQTAWKQSDNLASFRSALEDKGYFLAAGDRRGFVALDATGDVFSVSRFSGVKTKELNARLGDPGRLPGVEEVKDQTRARLREAVVEKLKAERAQQIEDRRPLETERREMAQQQRLERIRMRRGQEQRRVRENRERAARMRSGVRGVWDILTGRAATVRRQNEAEAYQSYLRDRAQKEALFEAQFRERRAIQQRIETVRREQREARAKLARHIGSLLKFGGPARNDPRSRGQSNSHDRGLEP